MNLFQSPEWEEFKLATGYQKSYRIDGVLVLQKNLPFGRTMLYSPMVSEQGLAGIQNSELRIKQEFINQIKVLAKKFNAIFYRLEFDMSTKEANGQRPTANGFIKSFEEMQPEHTLILDISKSEEEILAQMKPKGRYNIKVAEKSGVKIIEERDINSFFSLYSAMAKRHNITYRGREYFQKLFDITHKKDYSKVFTAYIANPKIQETNPKQNSNFNNQIPIASVIISFYGNRATYLFGGSSDEYRNIMAPYLLQWTAILEAKKRDCTEYDFFGIAPQNMPNHPWRGVTDFKKKFGGEEVELLGSWDLVLKLAEYGIFRMAEKIRRK